MLHDDDDDSGGNDNIEIYILLQFLSAVYFRSSAMIHMLFHNSFLLNFIHIFRVNSETILNFYAKPFL